MFEIRSFRGNTGGCLRPRQSRRSEDTGWLRVLSGTCWTIPSHEAPGERRQCSPTVRWSKIPHPVPGGTELILQPWHYRGKRCCCDSAQCHGGLAAEHVCSCFATSGVIWQEHCPEIQNFLILPLSCACSTTPLPWRWLLTCALHQPQEAAGFHVPALVKTSQAGGTRTLERKTTLCSHLPVSFNLCKFFWLVGYILNIKPLKTSFASKKKKKKRV